MQVLASKKIIKKIMASVAASENQWFKGRVKAVTSGDCLVITALTHNRAGPPPEKTITLSSLMAPKLVSPPQVSYSGGYAKATFTFKKLQDNFSDIGER